MAGAKPCHRPCLPPHPELLPYGRVKPKEVRSVDAMVKPGTAGGGVPRLVTEPASPWPDCVSAIHVVDVVLEVLIETVQVRDERVVVVACHS